MSEQKWPINCYFYVSRGMRVFPDGAAVGEINRNWKVFQEGDIRTSGNRMLFG